jgi:hypothetical protein
MPRREIEPQQEEKVEFAVGEKVNWKQEHQENPALRELMERLGEGPFVIKDMDTELMKRAKALAPDAHPQLLTIESNNGETASINGSWLETAE